MAFSLPSLKAPLLLAVAYCFVFMQVVVGQDDIMAPAMRGGVLPTSPPYTGPTPPQNPTRPSGWPGGASPAANNSAATGMPPASAWVRPAAANVPAMPPPGARPFANSRGAMDAQLPEINPDFRGDEIIARVGSVEVVLAREVMAAVNETLQHGLAKSKQQVDPAEISKVRLQLTYNFLQMAVKYKLLYAEAKKNIPITNWPKLEAQVRKVFESDQLPKLMESLQCKTYSELDAKLRSQGSSLADQRRSYLERTVGMQWLNQQVKEQKPATHQDMLDYYAAHGSDFDVPAKARWEHLLVKPTHCETPAASYQLICARGNELLKGANFAQIAKDNSDDLTASSGGLHDWTTKGALVSEALDQAIFGLPVGALSQVLEDDRGYHIVRVVERSEFRRQPFTEAQAKIKESLKKEDKSKQMDQYVERVREKTPVWTIFDDMPDFQQARKPRGAR